MLEMYSPYTRRCTAGLTGLSPQPQDGTMDKHQCFRSNRDVPPAPRWHDSQTSRRLVLKHHQGQFDVVMIKKRFTQTSHKSTAQAAMNLPHCFNDRFGPWELDGALKRHYRRGDGHRGDGPGDFARCRATLPTCEMMTDFPLTQHDKIVCEKLILGETDTAVTACNLTPL
uniref:Uncharacterized protein n=1 Tax=Branchiostoma floridae TaxID=7739 RepID=C3YSU7_BRAFL|eukprot:XP_002600599.1 hypothetical protein BRAFLDRAFT_101624 [Branchiostoma floridae]